MTKAERDYKQALDEIMELCVRATYYTRRLALIHETAMLALGMPEEHRMYRHKKAEDDANLRQINRRMKQVRNQQG